MRKIAIYLLLALIGPASCAPAPPSQPTITYAPRPTARPPDSDNLTALPSAGPVYVDPTISTVTVNLTSNISVDYRADISTLAGQSRVNIIAVSYSGHQGIGIVAPSFNVSAKAINAPPEIHFDNNGYAKSDYQSPLSFIKCVMILNIDPTTKPGSYTFQIVINVDGVDVGTIPCTVNVIQWN